MTRKDYVAIAGAIKAAKADIKDPDADHVDLFALYIADVMARDNPRFNRGRFLKACGVQS